MMSRLTSLVVMVASLLVLSGCEQQEVSMESETLPKVRFLKVVPEKIQPTLKLTGTVVSQQIAKVHPEIEGTVHTVTVRIGDKVQPGDTLVQLDPSRLELRLKSSAAERLKAESELARMLRGYRPEDIEAVRTKLENARAIFQRLELNRERNEALFSQKVMTEKQYEEYQAERLAFRALMNSASAELKKMLAGYEIYDIQSASATVQLTRAQEALAQRDLDFSTIRSPIHGVVTVRRVEVGMLVNPSMEIIEIKDPSKVWLMTNVSERDCMRIHTGLTADLYNDANGIVARGFVDRLAQTLDPGTKSLTVWLAWNDPNQIPPIGSFARASLELKQIPDVICLRREWIHLSAGQHYVWVLENDRLKKTNIVLGEDRGDEVVVNQGLGKDMLVVVSPPTNFKEGMVVLSQPYTPLEEQPSDEKQLAISSAIH